MNPLLNIPDGIDHRGENRQGKIRIPLSAELHELVRPVLLLLQRKQVQTCHLGHGFPFVAVAATFINRAPQQGQRVVRSDGQRYRASFDNVLGQRLHRQGFMFLLQIQHAPGRIGQRDRRPAVRLRGMNQLGGYGHEIVGLPPAGHRIFHRSDDPLIF